MLRDTFAKCKSVGASTATLSGGALIDQSVFGYENSRTKTPVSTSTRFQAASMSKTVNAVAVLTLVNRGLISLDVPVNTYLTRWRLLGAHGDKVTVKQLLSHSAATTVHGFRGYSATDTIPSTIEILDGLGSSNSPAVIVEGTPGKTYKYSGGGTTVLQALVEDVLKKPYAEVVSEQVFSPLDMKCSSYSAPAHLKDYSCAHTRSGNPIRGLYKRHPELAAAGLWTTPGNFAKLLIDLFRSLTGSSSTVLPYELSSLMVSPVIADSALGVFVGKNGIIGHSGVNYGFRSNFLFQLASGNGVVAFTNGEQKGSPSLELCRAIRGQQDW